MSAPTADLPRISRYTASRDQPCTSGQDCAGVKAGERAAYVGWTTGSGAVCGPCLDELDRNIATASGEPGAADPLADGPMPADPFLPEGAPAPQVSEQDLIATLWAATDSDGRVETVHFVEDLRRALAGRGLILLHDGVWWITDAGRTAIARQDTDDEHGWPEEEPAIGEPSYEPSIAGGEGGVDEPLEGDDPADEPQPEDVHECECKRVTSRAKFGRTPDGRPTHEHCGGVLREKHQHLALAANPENTEPTPETEPTEAQTDVRDQSPGVDPHSTRASSDASRQPVGRDNAGSGHRAAGDHPADPAPAADPGADPGAGVEAGSADGAAGASEAGGEGGDGAGEGDHGGDQGGDLPAGPRGGDHPEPVRVEAVEAVADRDVAVRLDGVQEGVPGGVRPLGEEVRELAPGRDGLTPQAPGGLAAFYAQPVGEDDDRAPGAGSLAAFYGQPDDEALDWDPQGAVETLNWASRVGPPDSDNYLGEFYVGELLDELGRRLLGQITALIVAVGETQPRVFEVPR